MKSIEEKYLKAAFSVTDAIKTAISVREMATRLWKNHCRISPCHLSHTHPINPFPTP
jgi:hypothetical protein